MPSRASKPVPDVAYLVHETDNESLRHSLRSLARNAIGLFGRVWIVGVLPQWVTGVEHLPLEHAGEKFADIRAKVTALASHDGVADEVVIMCDDVFIVDPITTWAPFHMGSTAAYLDAEASRGRVPARNTWIRAVANTAQWMAEQGHGDIDCYEGHVPLCFDRHRLADVLAQYPTDRTCDYPGFYPLAGAAGEGVQAGNAKVKELDGPEFEAKLALPIPYLSTNDASFRDGVVGGFIRGLFRQPCQYEETP